MLTTSIFLTVFFGTIAIVLTGLTFFIVLFILPLKKDMVEIRDSVKPLKQIDEEIHRIGLHGYLMSLVKPEEHHSLTPEKAQRKEELLNIGRLYGLDPNEAEELNALLRKEAMDDFALGLIEVIALMTLFAFITALIKSLAKKPDSKRQQK